MHDRGGSVQVPWFDFPFSKSLGIGVVIGLVLGAAVRTILSAS